MKAAAGKTRAELALILLLLGAGLGLLQPGLVLLAAAMVVHLTVGLSLARTAAGPRLQARRRLSAETIGEGDRLEVAVAVENLGPALDLVALEDPPSLGLTVQEGEAVAVAPLPSGERAGLRYTVRARRGRYQQAAVRVEARDLLGYSVWRAELPCPAALMALPRQESLRGIAIAPRRTLVVPGTARARRGGSGSEWFGTREYRPGDPIRRIHWKALARWGKPVVVEFEEERAADVVVILDVRQRAYPPEAAQDLLDVGARAAAALCDAFLLEGHRVGLLLYGSYLDWVVPGYGRRHARRLWRELARARLGSSEVFAELGRLPTRLLGSGSQVVLVSPLVEGDDGDLGQLVARGHPVLALVPEGPPPEEPRRNHRPELALASRLLALERRALLRKLRLAGVRPLVWDVRQPLAPLVRSAWRRVPWR